ncbi:MAG: PAS domain-containing sensor histidine kinase [Pyrinomonadaceae bacterium]
MKDGEHGERRRYEDKNFLTALIQNLPGTIYRFRADELLSVEFISDGCLDLTGCEAAELNRQASWMQMIYAGDRARVRAEHGRLTRERKLSATSLDYRIVTSDGTIKHVCDCFNFICDTDEKIVAVEGLITDLTDRAIAAERLRESESRYRLLAENMHDLVCLHGLDGTYEYVSPSSETLLGYRPEELVGTSPYNLIHPEEVNCVREDMHERLLKGETDLTIDYRQRKKSGEYVWVETMAQIIKDADGKSSQILTVSRDVSTRKRAEQERAAAQDEIARFFFNEQSARAEAETAHRAAEHATHAKDEFLQLISHEFRTPLTTIKTLARIMQQGGESPDERDEYLETIAAECDRQIDMILNLLDVARIDEGSIDLRKEPVNVNSVLRACDKIERYAANAREQIFNVKYDEHLPPAAGDEKAIRRALCSIIENAIKYTPIGGAITLSAKCAPTESGETKLKLGKNPIEEIAIVVKDTGRGIHPEDVPRLFQKFYRGKKTVPHDHTTDGTPDDAAGRAETPGVGLGLYLAKRLIAELGGRITAESEIGRGSTFTVFLPVWDAALEVDTVDEYGFDEGVAAG